MSQTSQVEVMRSPSCIHGSAFGFEGAGIAADGEAGAAEFCAAAPHGKDAVAAIAKIADRIPTGRNRSSIIFPNARANPALLPGIPHILRSDRGYAAIGLTGNTSMTLSMLATRRSSGGVGCVAATGGTAGAVTITFTR